MNRNTVNKYYNKIRQLIYHHQVHQMKRFVDGEIEVDESYFGPRRIKGKSSKRGRGTSFKKVVFGIYERKRASIHSYHTKLQKKDITCCYEKKNRYN